MQKLYSIQGVIFQRDLLFSIGYLSDAGSVAMMQEVMKSAMCHGIVELQGDETYAGALWDAWGLSAITDFKITDTEVIYTKIYENRPPIYYRFTKGEGETWIGNYSGADCGTGESKCLITPIMESFLLPTKKEEADTNLPPPEAGT